MFVLCCNILEKGPLPTKINFSLHGESNGRMCMS